MHISNPTNLAICNLRRWAEQNDMACSHIVEWYRQQLQLQKAARR